MIILDRSFTLHNEIKLKENERMKTKTITGVMITLILTSVIAFGVAPVNAGAGILETLTVQANNPNPTYSTTVLQDGWWYVIEVSGTWVNFGTRQVDAKYWSDDNWVTYNDLLPWAGADDQQLELVIDGNRIDWGDYRADHTYFTMYEGKGHTAAFLAFLVYEMQAGWYGDNTGSLTITIYVSGQLPLYRGWNIFTEPGSGKVKYKFVDKRDKLLTTVILEGAQANHDYRVYFGPHYITGEGDIDPGWQWLFCRAFD